MVPRLRRDNESRGWRGSRLGGGRGVHCQVFLGRGGRRPRPPVPGPRPPQLCFLHKKTPTNHPGKVSVMEGASVKSQIYLPEMICVNQQPQRLLFFFSVFFFFLLLFSLLLRRRGPFTRRSLRKHSRANPEAGNVGCRLISDRALRLPNVVVIGGDSPGG